MTVTPSDLFPRRRPIGVDASSELKNTKAVTDSEALPPDKLAATSGPLGMCGAGEDSSGILVADSSAAATSFAYRSRSWPGVSAQPLISAVMTAKRRAWRSRGALPISRHTFTEMERHVPDQQLRQPSHLAPPVEKSCGGARQRYGSRLEHDRLGPRADRFQGTPADHRTRLATRHSVDARHLSPSKRTDFRAWLRDDAVARRGRD